MNRASLLLMAIILSLPLSGPAHAGEVLAAVAINFTQPMQKLVAEFEHESGHKVTLAFGSTGKFYSQIANGAPFAILLAADDETPARLEQEGHAISGSRFTYAIGKVVLWSAREGYVDAKGEILKRGAFSHVAVANPKVAPYGTAAMQVLDKLGLLTAIQPRIVQGENIGQTHQFVVSGNAELGFVALSQISRDGKLLSGSAWLIPENLHDPIRQDAVLLKAGAANPAAVAFLQYLKNPRSRATIRSFGYELP